MLIKLNQNSNTASIYFQSVYYTLYNFQKKKKNTCRAVFPRKTSRKIDYTKNQVNTHKKNN